MVKIVTDSCSDIGPELAQRFGISVVPLYVNFGTESYRDNVDISPEEFYRKLTQSKTLPTTSTVSPDFFAQLFTELAEETNEFLTITVSQMWSGTYGAALQSKAMVANKCRVEVIDSQFGAGGQMLLVISAAQMAKSGANLDQVVDHARKAIPQIDTRAAFDTLEYLRRGGRIGRAQAFLGSLLKINPVLAIRDGQTFPIAKLHSRTEAIDFLVDFVKSSCPIEALALEDATTPDELEILAQRLKDVAPPEHIYRSKVSPVVGTHVGPHVLIASVLKAKQ